MKKPSDITNEDIINAMDSADALEREVLQQALRCGKTSCQWMVAANVYNSIKFKKA